MKLLFKLSLVFFLCVSQIAFAQQVDKRQVEIATTFINLIRKGEIEKSWELVDKTNVPDVTKEQFVTSMTQLQKDLSLFDTVDLTMNGIKFAGDKQLNFYTFKAISTSKNIVNDISVDILFYSSSQLIAGVQPKKLLKDNTASTSKGKETQLEKGFTAVIDGITYKITGINIVHFENNEGLLAIQVEYPLPSDEKDINAFAKKEAIKFAKYLVNNGYVDKAKLKAKEIDRKLLDDIGVSFLDPNKGGGYNIMVKPNEYK